MLDGIVNCPEHAINQARKATPFSYRVHAQFEKNTGASKRMSGRPCSFKFTRQFAEHQ